MFEDKSREKMKSDDRTLVLSKIEGKLTKDSLGSVDPRLFQGGNNVHAVRDSQTSLWGLKYEYGILPEPLKQKYTNFNTLYRNVAAYFERRGLQITEVID